MKLALVKPPAGTVGSLNGSYVNQKQLDGPQELVDGDVLQIGKFKLLFFRGEG